ncbi:hypothetical protein [Desulfonema magnum]|uniref:Uncharacterized protein n=1 Tax=Desulfonema magnum TaxID=45655 RepID=A0A975BVQ9_9BACT|nr:hypothetical protein [Desulfonema magnum]QTA92705.1 Uncharacterized protein dnm_087940 [Desulfonema magnum]
MNANFFELILSFFDAVMKQDPCSRQQILCLLKKHFDNFRKELAQVQAGGDMTPEPDLSGSDEADSEPSSPSEVEEEASISELENLLILTEKSLRRQMIFHELLSPPLSERDEDGFF